MPGITTIAKTRVIPATKEHNSADEIKDISNIFTYSHSIVPGGLEVMS